MRCLFVFWFLSFLLALGAQAAPTPRIDLFHLSAERVPGGLLLGAETIIRLEQKIVSPDRFSFTWELAAGDDSPTVRATGPTTFVSLQPGVDTISGTITARSYRDGVIIERPVSIALQPPRLSVVRQRGALRLPPGRLASGELLFVFPLNFSIPLVRLPVSWEQAGVIVQTGLRAEANTLGAADAVTITAGDPTISNEYAQLTVPLKP